MNKKRSLSLFLAASLLLLSVTSSYAAFWSNWTQYIQVPTMDSVSRLVDIDMAKKLSLVAILATLVAFVVWKNKNGGDNNGRDKSEAPIVPVAVFPERVSEMVKTVMQNQQEAVASVLPVEAVELTLEQFPVYGQFNSDGGGGASCGYQTLLRAMQLVRAKSFGESKSEFMKTLMDPSAIQVYFGPDGEWRKQIINYRKQKILKNILHAQFIAALRNTIDEKGQSLYKSAFGNLEDMVKQFINEQDANMPIDFSDNALKKYIRIGLGKLKYEKNVQQISDLEQSIVMKDAIDFDKVRAGIFARDDNFTVSDLLNKMDDMPELHQELTGEWLDDGEVEYLWRYEQDKVGTPIIPRDVMCGFKAIANFDFIGMEGVDEVTPYITEEVKPLLSRKQSLFQIFALGTMRQDGDQQGTRGHWYPLVMHQNSDGNRKYYIMDSADNSSVKRLDKNDNARQIISLIEY